MISICLLAFSAILIPLLPQFDICHRFIQHSAWMQVSWYTRLFLCFKKASSMNNVLLSLFLVLWCTMTLFWAIVVPWLQYLPEIHFWCVYELRDMSQHAVCCVSMRFFWWCIMYYHHYALYYDLSCQCAVQCTVILILLPVMWRPHFWIPLMMMTMEVAERALYCDSSILSDWRVKSHGWRVKKEKWDYPIVTIQTQIENFRLNAEKSRSLVGINCYSVQSRAQTFCEENFLLKGNISFGDRYKILQKKDADIFFSSNVYLSRSGKESYSSLTRKC